MDEQMLIKECISDAEKLQKHYKEEKGNTSFFISDSTMAAYRKYLSAMEEKANDIVKRMRCW